MTPELLASLTGIILSLLTAYLPGFSTWYAALTGERKRLLMLALLFLTAVGSFAATCAGTYFPAGFGFTLGINQTCDTPSAFALLRIFISALIANQSTYTLAVRKPSAISPQLSAKY